MMRESDFLAGLTRRGMVQQLMDNISDNINFNDADARIVLVNRAYARWFGFNAREELIGKTNRDLYGGTRLCGVCRRMANHGHRSAVIGIEEKETWSDVHRIPLLLTGALG